MTEDFKHQASKYAEFRPRYPETLFSWLAGLTPNKSCAWDCATGSGQAAMGLVRYFEKIVATDMLQKQIEHASQHPKIIYSCVPAERSGLPPKSVDLITVACAVHWFDRAEFYSHAKRVMRPGAIIAVWTYEWPWTGNRAVDRILLELQEKILGPYWPDEAKLYLERYENLDFPFDELEAPKLASEFGSTVWELIGLLSTWSAVQRFRAERGFNPIELVAEPIRRAWQREKIQGPLELPLYFRVGRYS